MSRVTMVRTKQLLNTVRENKTKHVYEYQKLVQEYNTALVEEVSEMLSNLREIRRVARKAIENNKLFDGVVRASSNLLKPESHADDYDRIIAMLELETREEIEVTEDEIRQYVLDQWKWTTQFYATKALYCK